MLSAGSSPFFGAKVNSHWLGPNSTSTERKGSPSASDVAAQDLQHRLDLVEALLGEVLIAVDEQAHRRRRAGLAGILGRAYARRRA